MRPGILHAIAALATIATLATLTGCGATSPVTTTTPSPTTSASALNGNWLLVGSLPFAGPFNLGSGSSTFGLATTFSTVGTHVIAGGTHNLTCNGFTSSGAGELIQGDVATDGSFTLSPNTTGLPTPTLTLSGKVPATGANTFSGNYTFNSGTGSSCTVAQSGPFTAVRIADVTGTFTGPATLTQTSGTNFLGNVPVTVSFVLQQGATPAGTTSFDAELLTGTLKIQGTPCFATGTLALGSGVLGSTAVVEATLNDGSSAISTADIQDLATTRLNVHTLSISGSTCGTFFSGPFVLTRQ